ncbi:uncharacterized protein LOC134843590 [Symsagittifera roscoffensis]|uniref:uncharacterized protein LOC134843590 n=1 Tax=Symsagittifera roscoffensis TaxID=84072 RepID=UPI00307B68B2
MRSNPLKNFSLTRRGQPYKEWHSLKGGAEFMFIASEQNDVLKANPKIEPRLEDFMEMIQREVGSSVIVKRCVTEQGESITSWKVHCALPSKPAAIRSVYVVQCARSSHWSVLTLHRKDPMEWMYEGNNGRTDRSSHAHHVHQHKMWKY